MIVTMMRKNKSYESTLNCFYLAEYIVHNPTKGEEREGMLKEPTYDTDSLNLSSSHYIILVVLSVYSSYF